MGLTWRLHQPLQKFLQVIAGQILQAVKELKEQLPIRLKKLKATKQ
jgi:hypothetical protein